MPSIPSRLVYGLMKYRHLMRFRLTAERWDESTSIPAFRELCEAGALRTKMPEGVSISPVAIEGLTGSGGRRAEWLLPVDPMKDKAILYTVGGGYVSGSCSDHRALVAKITQGSQVSTLLFDHRWAPEDPFPAALEDSLCAYRWLLAQGISSSDILIAGESAGGGLCLATLIAIRDLGLPLPSGAAAISPWTDLALSGDSYRTRLAASIDPPGMSTVCSKYYVGDHDPREPWISPLYADLHGLPPIFICVGTNETMLDDSTRFAEKAREAGVDVTLRVWEEMIHCFPLMAPLFPEATQALNEICDFLKMRLARSEPLREAGD